MPYDLEVNLMNMPKGAEVFISGLGTFANGSTTEISDEQAEAFRAAYMVDQGGVDDNPESETFGSYTPNHVPGPDLATAAETMHGVTVTKSKPEASTSKAAKETKAAVGASAKEGTATNTGGES